jgi:hypothetical protein
MWMRRRRGGRGRRGGRDLFAAESLSLPASSFSAGAVAPMRSWRGVADLELRYLMRKKALEIFWMRMGEAPVRVLVLVLGLRKGVVDAGQASDKNVADLSCDEQQHHHQSTTMATTNRQPRQQQLELQSLFMLTLTLTTFGIFERRGGVM